jgi:bifunctional DNA-binding transcriptional regulator/antitoxin component of YhaV-PrlF toxin-antitoxin module
MTISTLSSKHQTTLSAAIVKRLKLAPGTRLKQSVEGNRVILEPVQDVSTAFGALKPKRRFRSIREETEETELAIGKEVARGRNA